MAAATMVATGTTLHCTPALWASQVQAAVSTAAGLSATMVAAGYLAELLFSVLVLVPGERHAYVVAEGISWNYTTWLNIVFLGLAAALVVRFLTTGGRRMMAMMDGPEPTGAGSQHGAEPPAAS